MLACAIEARQDDERFYPARFGIHPGKLLDSKSAPVAQLDRALPSGGRGQGFESLRARHFYIPSPAPES